MQKKTQPLRRIVLLLILLGIVEATFLGRYTSTLANSYHSFTASLKEKQGPKRPTRYVNIESQLDYRLDVDIQNDEDNIGTDGIPIIVFTEHTPPSDNQLWRFVPDGKTDGYGLIQSKKKGDYFLDIKGGSTTSGTPVVAFGKRPSGSIPVSQLWKFVSVPLFDNDKSQGYIKNKSGLVLTLPTVSPGTPLIASTKTPSPDGPQIWMNFSQ